jgi:hypothetical protein
VGVVLAGLTLVACSGDDAEVAEAPAPTAVTTTTSPPRPTTTTSTIYAPGTVEAEVEAAYLRSWEVYSEAVYTLVLDEQALASVYAGDHLDTVRNEVQRKIAERRASFLSLEHSYEVEMTSSTTALIFDEQVNHHVLIDAETKEPIEPDPNQHLSAVVQLGLGSSGWRVERIELV